MIFYLFLISCVLVVIVYYLTKDPKRRIPHGLKEIVIEKGLPIIGVLNKVKGPLGNYLFELSKKHGPIYRVKFGMREFVVLNTYKYIKSAMMDHGDSLSGRWVLQKYIFVSDGAGIATLDGEIWAKQRSFVLKTLRDFGVGRSRSLEIVQGECLHLLDDLEKLNGRTVDFSSMIPMYTANIISKFVMNKRLSPKDRDLEVIENMMNVVAKKEDPVLNLALMFPFLDKHLWLMKFIVWITSRRALFDGCNKLFLKEIEAHVQNVDLNGEGEDLIDRFLIEQHKLKCKNGKVDTFTDWQLVKNALELLVGGYETTSTTLVWSFMFMGMYPDVQAKVHKEIIEKIGSEKLPTTSDKASFNYTQAVMDEIFRLSSIAPLASFHRTMNDVNVYGYFIRKDTLIIPNIFACHLDPTIWEKPFEFYPEHFLFEDTNGGIKYKPKEELIPFGMGKRQCLGESLARMEYFLFFTSIMQRFQVSFAKDLHMKKDFDVFDCNEGILRISNIKEFSFKRIYK